MTQPVQVLNLACNHCGASLKVKSGTQYVTCGYCGSQLMVHEDGGSLYTEVLNRIETKATNIEKGVEIIRLQNELERLDREYQNEKLEEKIDQSAKSKSQDSSSTPVGGIIGGLFAVIGLIVFLGFMFSSRHSRYLPAEIESQAFHPAGPDIPAIIPCIIVLAVLAIVGGIIYSVIKGMDDATAKDQREQEYHRRRREILDAMERQNQQS